ncbi:helix-turn-helix domain-containing protein [Bradyrhizobium neotropicale]|nr:helix-turn-helix domain-containing protein [Bradyrhizobium neotropicale]
MATATPPRKRRARCRDTIIAKQFRHNRIKDKLSQAQIAALMGVSRQQVQKYENGEDRIAASTLADISERLGWDILAILGLDQSPSTCKQPRRT